MAKRRPLTAITQAAERPISVEKVDPTDRPSTVNRVRSTPSAATWEERTKRHTYHADKPTLKALKSYSKSTGESLSSLINRSQRELLDREAPEPK